MKPVGRTVAYPAALVFGILFSAWLFPWSSIWPADPLHLAFEGDLAQSVLTQRYFLAAPWGWPLLLAPGLTPGGTNVALTDSIPLAMLLTKLFHAWLPRGFFVQAGWVATVWALQPVAAVFALRGAGERRWLPAVAVAVLAVSMPTLLMRYGHMALCAHAAILAALGGYFRIVAGGRRWPFAVATALSLTCTLIHPYILAITAGVLAAAPLTLLLRGDRRWQPVTLWFAANCAMLGVATTLIGFGGALPMGGFGFYSMNVLGPFLPNAKSPLGNYAIDATGGQGFEGYQYLGSGLLVLLALTAIPAVAGPARLPWGRHAGLVLVLAGMAALSLSNHVYLAQKLVLSLPDPPARLAQFRATGRFFWPVAYTLMLAAVVVAVRALPRRAAFAALALACGLQLFDTAPLRQGVRTGSHDPFPWSVNEPVLAPFFARHTSLTLWPTFGCGAVLENSVTMHVMLIASETVMPVNTMVMSRNVTEPDCNPVPLLSPPLRPGQIRVVQRLGDAWLVPDASNLCGKLGGLVICATDIATLPGVTPLAAPAVPLSHDITLPQTAATEALGPGWSSTSSDSVWSSASVATLQFHRPDAGPLELTLHGMGLSHEPGGQQIVHVVADGKTVATWRAPDLTEGRFHASLPADGVDPVVVQLRIDQPTRPIDRRMNGDTRSLGLLLLGFRLDPAP